MMLKITYYIFRQLGLTTLFLTLILTAAVWLTQSLHFVDGVLNKGLPLRTFFLLILTLVPDLITIVLPASLLIAVIFTYNRLIADQELVVMRSAGMNHWQLAKPALMVGTVVTLMLYAINIYILPSSYQKMRDIESSMHNTISSAMLQEGEFNSLKGLMVYIRKRQNQRDMKGILIYNNRNKDQPFLISAEAGSLLKTEDSMKLILLNGVRQDIDKKTNNPSMLYFDQYMLELEPNPGGAAGRRKRIHEYNIAELLSPTEEMGELHRHGRFRAQGHQRILSPLIAMAYTVIALAVMLQGQINRRRRTKKVMTIVGLACLLQLLTLVFINMSEHYEISLILGYATLLLAILLPLAHINEWYNLSRPIKYGKPSEGLAK
jgi:lipopolysaccharide export system permease protein